MPGLHSELSLRPKGFMPRGKHCETDSVNQLFIRRGSPREHGITVTDSHLTAIMFHLFITHQPAAWRAVQLFSVYAGFEGSGPFQLWTLVMQTLYQLRLGPG